MNILQKAVRKTKDLALRRSETEILVRDATNNERWGPTGTELKQIADKTFSYNDYADISRTLWERLEDTGKNWRHIYKALLVFDYLLKNGSDRFVQECKQRQFLIKTLQEFHYIDEDGTDVGVSIRARAKAVIELINDEKRLKRERKLALKNKDKYKQAIGSHTGYIGSGSRTSRNNNRYSDSEESSSEEERPQQRRGTRKTRNDYSEDEEDEEEVQNQPQQVQRQPQNTNNSVDLLFQDDIFSQPTQKPQNDFFFQPQPQQQNYQSNQFFQPQPQQQFKPQTNTSFSGFNQPSNDVFFNSTQTNGSTMDDEWNDFTGAQQNDIFQSQPQNQPTFQSQQQNQQTFQSQPQTQQTFQPIQPVQTMQPIQPVQPKSTQNQPSKTYDEKDPWSNSSLIDLSNLGL